MGVEARVCIFYSKPVTNQSAFDSRCLRCWRTATSVTLDSSLVTRWLHNHTVFKLPPLPKRPRHAPLSHPGLKTGCSNTGEDELPGSERNQQGWL